MPLRPTLELSPQDAAAMLQGLLAVNVAQMDRAGPNRPRIRDLIQRRLLVYDRDDPDERWQPYEELLGQIQRYGVAKADCEDLASALAADMRDDTDPYHDPDAHPIVYKSGPRLSHVIVESPRYGRLDPSRWAGMGSEHLHGQPVLQAAPWWWGWR